MSLVDLPGRRSRMLIVKSEDLPMNGTLMTTSNWLGGKGK